MKTWVKANWQWLVGLATLLVGAGALIFQALAYYKVPTERANRGLLFGAGAVLLAGVVWLAVLLRRTAVRWLERWRRPRFLVGREGGAVVRCLCLRGAKLPGNNEVKEISADLQRFPVPFRAIEVWATVPPRRGPQGEGGSALHVCAALEVYLPGGDGPFLVSIEINSAGDVIAHHWGNKEPQKAQGIWQPGEWCQLRLERLEDGTPVVLAGGAGRCQEFPMPRASKLEGPVKARVRMWYGWRDGAERIPDGQPCEAWFRDPKREM